MAVVLCALAGGSAISAATPTSASTASAPTSAGLLVTIHPAPRGPIIPADFLGLSLETPAVDSPAVVSTAPSLVHLLSGLGPGLLRISGDSVDHTQWLGSPPSAVAPWAAATLTRSDLGNLAALTAATGWRLILGLDLGHPMPAAIVDEARAADSTLGSSLAGLEIGNEPDLFTRRVAAPFRSLLGGTALRPPSWGFGAYQAELAKIRGALAAAGVSASLWGPDTATSSWLSRFAAASPPTVDALTQHIYPFDRCERGRLIRGPSPASLLEHETATRESRLIHRFVAVAAVRGLALRIDETNSVACAGQSGTSDTFAAALWALDYSLIAAQEGVAGLNFHGGLGSCRQGGTVVSPWYSPLCTSADGSLRARPEYYALLLLRSLEGCTFLRADYRTPRNVSVFALRASDGTLRVLIDDMDPPGPSRRGRPSGPVRVTLQVARAYQHGDVIRLSAPNVDAKDGVTLGRVSLGPDGILPPPQPEPLQGSSGRLLVDVAPGTAALATLTP